MKFVEYLVAKGVITKELLSKLLKKKELLRKKGIDKKIEDLIVEEGVVPQKKMDALYKDYSILREKGEWIYLTYHIRKKLGETKYREAVKKRDELKNKHFLEVLHIQRFLTYGEQKEIIYNLFKDFVPNLISGDVYKIIKREGRFFYKTDGDEEIEVLPVWIPSLAKARENIKQVLITKEEHQLISSIGVKNVRIRDRRDREDKEENLQIDLPFSFKDIVINALRENASDIHIVYDNEYYRVLFRIGDQVIEQERFLMDTEQGYYLVKQIMLESAQFVKGKFSADDTRKVQDGRIEYKGVEYDGVGYDDVDLRLVFIPDGNMQNMEVVARILKKQKIESSKLSALGYYKEDVDVIIRASRRLGGLFIISGITNSGKSTLAAHVVAQLPETKKIETVEDPIEYIIPKPNVVQHQIYEPKESSDKVSFLEYIKGFKRADPDIIMISEIRRNQELVDALIEASRAGQLIISTIHINSAFEIYRGFYDLFRIDLSTTAPLILFSMNQTLVPKLCDNCKVEDTEGLNKEYLEKVSDEIPFAVIDSLSEFISDAYVTTYRKGDGCEYCKGNGYKGRTVIYEYFYPDVGFIDWLISNNVMSRFDIEKKVYEKKIGKNRLEIFIKKLRDGIIDVSDRTLRAIS